MDNVNNTMDRIISDEEKRRKNTRRAIKVGVAIALAGAGIYGVSQFMRTSVSLDNLIVNEISRGTIETTINANGTVVPEFEEAIITPISTKILKVYAQSGEIVEEGTPLLQLDLQTAQTNYAKQLDEYRMKQLQTEQLRANKRTQLSDREMQIKVSQMQLGRLEVELRNERYLDSIGSGTMDRVRQAELAVNTARLELEQMRQRFDNERKVSEADMQLKQLENNIFAKGLEETRRTLEGAEIRSPRRATLTYICNEEIGTQISAGTKVAVVSDLTSFKLQCNIADAYSDQVRSGGKVVVKIGSTNLPGTIISVTPMSENGLIKFNVTLEDPDHSKLRSGLRADVHVLTSIKDNVLRIKNSSFYKGPDTYQLFVLTDNGTAEKRSVRLGDCNFDFIEVLEGLNEGDRVIISDMSSYSSIAEIKIKE
jgi:HlyD family secretion protein